MSNVSLTVPELLASYWLADRNPPSDFNNIHQSLRKHAEAKGLSASDEVIDEASKHLDGEFIKGDIEQWIVSVFFTGHPHGIWNFMLDAMRMAESDDNLQKIATGLAEHLLAHYGSMVRHFEARASKSPEFRRMLTGVWRHRMSDDVWMRLRSIQSHVPDPLPGLIPLDRGVEYMRDSLSVEDRETADKGWYRRTSSGEWVKRTNS